MRSRAAALRSLTAVGRRRSSEGVKGREAAIFSSITLSICPVTVSS